MLRGYAKQLTSPARRLRNLLQFQLERMILRGASSRLAVIAAIIGLVSLVGGLMAFSVTGGYEDRGSAVWWAFLRLTDPGYLGDDEGLWLRVISTIVTVLGYVLFMGSLIAIMTQWLQQTLERLEQGLTPIAENDHILILGWTSRTVPLVEQLLRSEGRLKRLTERLGRRRLRVVILAERVTNAHFQELKDQLGDLWNPNRILLRSGNPLRVEHLQRVDYLHASVIILPVSEFIGASSPDERTVKTLLTSSHSAQLPEGMTMPLMVTELFDSEHLVAARAAYPGQAEIIGTVQLIARLIAHTARNPGLSYVYNELLRQKGNEIYVRDFPEFAGRPAAELADAFDEAVLLGFTRPSTREFIPLYRADTDDRLQEGDRLALIARSFEACSPREDFGSDNGLPAAGQRPRSDEPRSRRVLILGWNNKLPSLVSEFDQYSNETTQLDIVSLIPAEERDRILYRRGATPSHVSVRQVEADFASYTEMLEAKPWTYDNIILIASDWLPSAEQADARSLLGFLVLQHELEGHSERPHLFVEAMSESNIGCFSSAGVEVEVSPDLQSHMLTQVALRRDLHWVYEEIFGASGAEVLFRRAGEIGLAGREMSFALIRREAIKTGDIALGVRRAGEAGVTLNPPRTSSWRLAENDQVLVLDVS